MGTEYKLNVNEEIYFFYDKLNYESLALKVRVYVFYGAANLYITKMN